MITLRPYQHEAIEKTKAYIDSGQKQGVIVAATGTGKSIMIASVSKTFSDKRILILAHRKKLLAQIGEKITENISLYSAGMGKKCLKNRIVCAGIQSLYSVHLSGELPKFDICLIDECHMVNTLGKSGQYYSLLSALIDEGCALVGLTATPFRNGEKSIIDGEIFSDLIYDAGSSASINRFIKKGYLSPLISPPIGNILKNEKIKKIAKDYSMADATRVLSPLTYDAIKNNIAHIEKRKKVLVFCASIEHADKTGLIFNELNYPAIVIHSKIENVDEKINTFATADKIKILINVDLLTTGFDLPIIDTLFFLRPTLSPTLWVQMLGRGMRIAENKKDCLVIDPVGNINHFKGFFKCINEALKENKTAFSDVGSTLETENDSDKICERYCPHCQAVSYQFVCEYCGKEKVKIITEAEKLKTESPIKKVTWATYKTLRSKKGEPMILVNFSYKDDRKTKWASLFLMPEHKSQWVRQKCYSYLKKSAPSLTTKVENKTLKINDIVAIITNKFIKRPLYITVKKSSKYTNVDKIYWEM